MDTVVKSAASLIDELSAEHAELLPEIEKLMNLASVNAPALRDLVGQIADRIGAALDDHIAQEDKVLFPAYAKAAGDSGLVDQFAAEHRDILGLRDALLAEHRAGGKLDGVALRLADLLTSHMTREEMMLFPTVRDTLG